MLSYTLQMSASKQPAATFLIFVRLIIYKWLSMIKIRCYVVKVYEC